jgi:CubicO group peptidase (beta-lactamase class C family)
MPFLRRHLPAGLIAAVLAALVLAVPMAGAAKAPTSTPSLAWPDSPAAQHARAWFAAFNAGEAEMRDMYAKHFSASSLANRPIEARLTQYRQMREEQGSLTPVRIAGVTDDRAQVIARAADGSFLELSFEVDPDAPHGIVGIRMSPSEGPADASGPPLDEAAAVAEMRAVLDRAAQADSFSGAALLARDGVPLMREARGLAERHFASPNRPSTRFNLGSINKMFTKTAIAQLAEQGKLSLDDPLTRWLPDWPGASASKITVAMLVEHRAGIGDFFNSRYDAADRSKLRHNHDYLALFRDQPLWFEPGTSQRYSNGSYVLLGEIIAKASGQDYYDYMREHVWGPAGMTATGYFAADEPVADLAMGYTRGEDGREPLHENVFTRPARGSAAGGGYSTIDDMLRFDQALLSNRLCPAGWTTWVIGGPPPGRNVGAATGRASEPVHMGFAGGAPGISAEYEHDGPFTLIVLGNLDPPWTQDMAGKLRRIMRRIRS